MRLLITGAKGRLGSRLVQILSDKHDVTGIDIDELDVTDSIRVSDFVAENQPDLVIHTAAWTDVDGCAREPQKAVKINGFGTQNLAIASAQIGAAMLYISSNEVFDGAQTQPYQEYDITHPINPYGYSKWVGERTLGRANPKHYVVRTSWLFAHGGKNFIQAILNAVKAGKSLRVVTNEVANPTYNDDLADAIAQLIETGRYGVYHLVNEGGCSRWDFARYVLDKAGYTDTPIAKISATEWQRDSMPPEYSSLANIAGEMIGIKLRSWQEAVDAFLEKEGLLS